MSKQEESGTSAEKIRKIAVATTVAGVLLIVFLVIVLIIQFVQLGVRNSRKRELDRLIEEQKQTLGSAEEELEFFGTWSGMFWKAFDEYGYKYKD